MEFSKLYHQADPLQEFNNRIYHNIYLSTEFRVNQHNIQSKIKVKIQMLKAKLTFILLLFISGVFCQEVVDETEVSVDQTPAASIDELNSGQFLGGDQPDPNLDQTFIQQGANIDGKGLRRPCRYACRVGYHCVNGQCVPYGRCPKIPCKKGYRCIRGTCVKIGPQPGNIVVCPSDSIKPKVCTIRPTEKQCPTIYYYRQPDPVACGIRADGTRVSFSEDCSACKDKNIVYYFSQPCHKIPFICSKNQECLGYYCGNSICSRSEDCPYDWQACSNGKCVDPCIYMKCRDCKYGKCAYVQPNGDCFFDDDSKCLYGWKCIVSQCGDLCWNKPCPPNQNCNKNDGLCY